MYDNNKNYMITLVFRVRTLKKSYDNDDTNDKIKCTMTIKQVTMTTTKFIRQ